MQFSILTLLTAAVGVVAIPVSPLSKTSNEGLQLTSLSPAFLPLLPPGLSSLL